SYTSYTSYTNADTNAPTNAATSYTSYTSYTNADTNAPTNAATSYTSYTSYTNADTNAPTNAATHYTGYTNKATNAPTNAATHYTGYTNKATNAPTNAATHYTSYTNKATNAATKTTSTCSTVGSCIYGTQCSVYGNANIELANGTTELASEIKPGTVILSYNMYSHTLEPSVITAVYSRVATNKYIFNNNLSVDGTEIMFINGQWVRAYTARVGDVYYDPLLGKNITINSIQIFNNASGIGKVYDFVGSPVNDYLANGFIIDLDTTSSCTQYLSFSGTSSITMFNGTTIEADKLSPGMVLLSYNTQTGELVPSVVLSVTPHTVNQEYVINGNLTVDANEPLYVNGQLIRASKIKIGDMLFSPLTNKQVPVESITIVSMTETVYDVNAAPVDNLIVDGYLAT
ncbi:MAG: Hint domain-containing protein, partial [Candidatus Micrarchaeaceae archaeon]